MLSTLCTYLTGISDFHKMTITEMKVIFKKQKPKIILYHNYKNFDKKSFLKISQEKFKSVWSFQIRIKGFSKCFFKTSK